MKAAAFFLSAVKRPAFIALFSKFNDLHENRNIFLRNMR